MRRGTMCAARYITSVSASSGSSARSFETQLRNSGLIKAGVVRGEKIEGKLTKKMKNNIYQVDLGTKFPSYVMLTGAASTQLGVNDTIPLFIRELECCKVVSGIPKAVSLHEGEVEFDPSSLSRINNYEY